ncbi:MAG: molybdopterin oxidoreductase family protein, partial [Gammaproteobacteria bacterium]|nr:molybdopterin oxidoreductase family protein [Gammaproteobacteria bacterium]
EALRLDRAFSWEAPLAIHGLMHMVIARAYEAGPSRIDTLFLFMANMAWNSAMNPGETTRMLSESDEHGNYRIPFVIVADAFASETVAYADLVLPDTTYLERYDCISLLDRPIGSAHGPADAIRVPVLRPDRDVRPFQDVLIDLAGRLGLEDFADAQGSPLYSSYADYIVRHERAPGIGPLAGFRGADARAIGKGSPYARQLQRYVDNGGFWKHELPPEQLYFKHANRAYLAGAKAMGFIADDGQIVLQLYCETLQKFRLAAEGHGDRRPPERLRARIGEFFDPLPIWYVPLEEALSDRTRFPLHAITQRPMAMYHSWGSHNAWLRQILPENRLYLHRDLAASIGVTADDWVWVHSRNGKLRCQVRTMTGVNRDTVWTWNAVGKRAGAWALEQNAPEFRRAFLLNHIISEYLPRQGRDAPQSNSDPVTGQAAWFDLTVSIEPCGPDTPAEVAPRLGANPVRLKQPTENGR